MSKKFIVDWSRYSEPQLKCVMLLHGFVPMHQTYLTLAGVRSNTRESLIYGGLIQREYLVDRHHPDITPMPFYHLTRNGQAIKRDYVMAMRRVRDIAGSLHPALQAIADTKL